MAGTAEFKGWLTKELKKLGLDDQVYTDYIYGMLEDDSTPDDEKKEALNEFLSAATEKELGGFLDELILKSRGASEEKAKKEADEKSKKQSENSFEKIVQNRTLEEESLYLLITKTAINDQADVSLSKDERRKRDAMLKRYGYDDYETDATGELVYTVETGNKKALNTDTIVETVSRVIESNSNAQRVADADAIQREKSKKEHEKKVQRDKEALEKDKERKEKAKQRTQKQEKRRL